MKNILVITEANYLNTGYATLGFEIMKRLYETQNYNLAELSIYGTKDNPERKSVPWKTFPNQPSSSDSQEVWDKYNSSESNKFGMWRFNQALLLHKADYVLSFSDPWMCAFIPQSPYKRFFNWIHMPTVDCKPQKTEWVNDCYLADGVLSYSKFGEGVLKNQYPEIKYFGHAPPAASEEFSPVRDKREHKKNLGLDPNIKIVGTVMRNQRRKIFPKLFEGFRKYIENGGDGLLYCHTSYPDNGWDLPRYAIKNGLSNKILYTYTCRSCKFNYPSFFYGSNIKCPNCSEFRSSLSSVKDGVSSSDLSKIYNLFDLYIQPCNSGGFEMPVVEAAACGVPVACTDYSATEDFKETLNAIPIRNSLYHEIEKECLSANPDSEHIAEIIKTFLVKPSSLRQIEGQKCREAFTKNYSWDKSAEKWINVIEALPVKGWNLPEKIHKPSEKVPENLTNSQFVRWCIVNVLGSIEILNTYRHMCILRDLNNGMFKPSPQGWNASDFNPEDMKYHKFNRKMILESFINKANYNNYWEAIRVGKEELPREDWMND